MLTKEIKQTNKEVYEWEKRVVGLGTEVELTKEKNQDLMTVIQMVKKDPTLIEKMAKNATQAKKKTSK